MKDSTRVSESERESSCIVDRFTQWLKRQLVGTNPTSGRGRIVPRLIPGTTEEVKNFVEFFNKILQSLAMEVDVVVLLIQGRHDVVVEVCSAVCDADLGAEDERRALFERDGGLDD